MELIPKEVPIEIKFYEPAISYKLNKNGIKEGILKQDDIKFTLGLLEESSEIQNIIKLMYGGGKNHETLSFEPKKSMIRVCSKETIETIDNIINNEDINFTGQILEKASLNYDKKIVAPIIVPWFLLKYGSLKEALNHGNEVAELLKSKIRKESNYIVLPPPNILFARTISPLPSGYILANNLTDPFVRLDERIEELAKEDDFINDPIIRVVESPHSWSYGLYLTGLLADTNPNLKNYKIKIHGTGYGSDLSCLYSLAQSKVTRQMRKGIVEILNLRRPNIESIYPLVEDSESDKRPKLNTNNLERTSMEFHPFFVDPYDPNYPSIFKKIFSALPPPHINFLKEDPSKETYSIRYRKYDLLKVLTPPKG